MNQKALKITGIVFLIITLMLSAAVFTLTRDIARQRRALTYKPNLQVFMGRIPQGQDPGFLASIANLPGVYEAVPHRFTIAKQFNHPGDVQASLAVNSAGATHIENINRYHGTHFDPEAFMRGEFAIIVSDQPVGFYTVDFSFVIGAGEYDLSSPAHTLPIAGVVPYGLPWPDISYNRPDPDVGVITTMLIADNLFTAMVDAQGADPVHPILIEVFCDPAYEPAIAMALTTMLAGTPAFVTDAMGITPGGTNQLQSNQNLRTFTLTAGAAFLAFGLLAILKSMD